MFVKYAVPSSANGVQNRLEVKRGEGEITKSKYLVSDNIHTSHEFVLEWLYVC